MLSVDQLTGGHLPRYLLCLTFDDGPGTSRGSCGPKTLALAKYLVSEGIYATFFFTGEAVERHPRVAAAVAGMGHLIGNHSYSHPRMIDPRYDRAGSLAELDRTSGLIARYCRDKVIWFRAPYGEWDEGMACYLNGRLDNRYTYRGPYRWDVDAKDWEFWRNGLSAEACAGAYLRAIEEKGRGIILLHDSSSDDIAIKKNNRTLEMVRLLIPCLKARGYRFTRLDNIPPAS